MSSSIQSQSLEELIELAREELYVAVVGDIMDKMGYRDQFLPPQIAPLREDMTLVGRVMTVLEADCYEKDGHQSQANPILNQPFGLMLQALDDLKPGEVYFCTGPTQPYAMWGELMTTRAMKLGAAGVVLNNYTRDSRSVLTMGFPVFGYGSYAKDQSVRGKVIDYRCPVECNGVLINDGDLIFGDIDGVCTVPIDIAEEVLIKALDKARGEKAVMVAIQGGQSAQSAFDEYGIM